MGQDEKALIRLWQEKRGEVGPEDLSGDLIVQLGLVTEDLNRRWYELNSGHRISDVQRHAIHRTLPWMAATLDGLVKETGAVRDCTDHRHRSGQWHRQLDNAPPAHLRGVDLLGLAGLPTIRDIRTPSDGGGTDLRPSLRTVYDGGNRWRGRP